MKDIWFFVYHFNALVVLWALPFMLASFNKKPLEIFIATLTILCIELFVMGISNLTSTKISRLIRSIWGGLLGIVAIVTVVQISYFMHSNGNLINWSLVQYTLDNTGVILNILLSEISLLWLGRFLLIIPIIYPITALGRHATRLKQQNRHLFATACLSVSIFMISAQAGLGLGYYINKPAKDTFILKIENHASRSQLNNLVSANAHNQDNYNIVIVILESVPAGATTMFSEKHDTTPFLNALSDTGLSANQAYVVLPHTSKAVTSILCGQPPDIHSRKIFGAEHGILPYNCLPTMLGNIGYKSAFFQTATQTFESRDKLTSAIGFDHFVPLEKINKKHWETVNYFGLEDKAMLEPAMEWVDNQKHPFLLSILTLTSHHNYKVPSTFPKKEYMENEVWNNHLNTVKYTDDFIHDLWTEFEKRDLLDNTLFVFVSDHGDRFDEKGSYGHHNSLHKDAIQIPLVFWNPDLISVPSVATGPRQQIDVLPTILDLLNLQTDQSNLPGLSLLEPAEDRIIYTACFLAPCMGRISINEKLIYHSELKYELIDIVKDKKEEHNLSSGLDEKTVNDFKEEIKAWQEDVKRLYY